MKQAAIDCFNVNAVENWEPFDTSSDVLPRDMSEALHLLLKHNLEHCTKNGSQTTKREISDLINEEYNVFLPFPPYYFVRGERRLGRAYSEINASDDELDPLIRFSYNNVDVKDYMAAQFGQVPDEEYPSHFIRALALYEAVIGTTHHCLGCKNEGTLKWNSSLRSDFCNLICSACGSVYTLCCVADSQKVQKLFEKRTHFRGSFAHFHQLKSTLQETSQGAGKMFLLLATRSYVDSESMSTGLPVFVAEIKGALPHLNSDSFSTDRIRIKSNLIFDPLNGRAPWFSITVPQEIDILGFSMEVFHEYFDALTEKVHDQEGESKAIQEENSSKEVNDSKQRQAGNLKKVMNQINNIKGKEERGVNLEKWEIDLLRREPKVLLKLEKLVRADKW